MDRKTALLAPASILCALAAAVAALSGGGFGPPLAAFLSGLAALLSLGLVLVLSRRAKQAGLEATKQEREKAAELKALGLSLEGLRSGFAALVAALPSAGRLKPLREAMEGLAASRGRDASLEKALAAAASLAHLAAGEAEETAAALAFEDARNVLPLARRIVEAVPAKTEEATMALIERFEAVRSLAAKAASASREALGHMQGGETTESLNATAKKTKGAIEAERKAVSTIVSNNRDNARKLQAMGKELESGIELIQGIEEITERSRLIAFNMAVEAARIGEKGRGFRVIVNELRSLNDRTTDFSHQVASLLGRYRDYNATLVSEMAEHSERLSGEVLDVMKVAGDAVQSLIDSSSTTEDVSTRLAHLVVDIDHDLDGVLEALQFQDVTRQMLEGALHIIEDAEGRLARALPLSAHLRGGDATGDATAAKRRLEELKRVFIAQAKTKDEKNAIARL